MEIKEVYKKVLKDLTRLKKQGKVAEFRGEQLYFTALVMGVVAKKDGNYTEFKEAELKEAHPDRYKQGIIDAENINMFENILFEAMSYNDEITRMFPNDKKEK
jgi:hypothetical protein